MGPGNTMISFQFCLNKKKITDLKLFKFIFQGEHNRTVARLEDDVARLTIQFEKVFTIFVAFSAFYPVKACMEYA